MFGMLFKQKNNRKAIAERLYGAALSHTRDEAFYTRYGVPDTFDGRFDLLLVHIFILLNRLMGDRDYDVVSQDLFDATFKDMDQTLRELGIGDMGVPKHMKRMMKAFNGRMHAYQAAVDPAFAAQEENQALKTVTLEEALRRNLYGTVNEEEGVDGHGLADMAAFIRCNLALCSEDEREAIKRGEAVFVKNEAPENVTQDTRKEVQG